MFTGADLSVLSRRLCAAPHPILKKHLLCAEGRTDDDLLARCLSALQAAVVPVLLSTANVSGIEWDAVDGSVLTQKTATLQVGPPRQCYLTSCRML